jgi:polar amino acid transport system substrate-binding protein
MRRNYYIALGTVFFLIICGTMGIAWTQLHLSPSYQAPTLAADMMAAINASGKMVIASQTAYPPWSDLKPWANRTAETRCAQNEYTAGELIGFDVDVAVEIARRLGVEPCFVLPPRTQVFSGSWADGWDIGIGSITITQERMNALYFTRPYKTTPSVFFVHKNTTDVAELSDLSEKMVGVCTGCIQERYLQGDLVIPGEEIDFAVKNATIVAYSSDTLAFPEIAAGRLDAVLVNEGIGLAAIKGGVPIKPLEPPAYYALVAAVFDKKSSRNVQSFVAKVNTIIQDMHQDGTLSRLINLYYPRDITSRAGRFNISALGEYP